MKNKKTIYIVIALTVFAVVIFSTVLAQSVFYYSSDSEIQIPSIVKEMSKGQSVDPVAFPDRLTIPSLSIDAHIQDVGITRKGNMATPNNFTDVGWYKYGTVPGETGSAVIAGHVDNGLALPAVFANLKNIKKGDDIYVMTVDGKQLHFKVTELATYDFNAPTGDIFTKNDTPYLKIITCTGVWLDQYRTHNKRLVVTSVLVK